MPRLIVFENVTLDGYFADAHGEWAGADKIPMMRNERLCRIQCEWRRPAGVREGLPTR